MEFAAQGFGMAKYDEAKYGLGPSRVGGVWCWAGLGDLSCVSVLERIRAYFARLYRALEYRLY